ncbi:hypothetical protein M1N19_00045 [Dehalococcoidia bacterium]|nr:hypothetical protein [Dehalococcoidia bacterium]
MKEMKTIEVTLPEKLRMEVENYVKSGWLLMKESYCELPCKSSFDIIGLN